MTDYNAVYESVMKYTRVPSSDVDSKDKLARWLRQNDAKNTLNPKLISELVETESARKDIEAAKGRDFEDVRKERVNRAAVNEQRFFSQKRNLDSRGFKVFGSVTTRSQGERFAVYKNSDNKLVFFDTKLNRAREVKEVNNRLVVTGRFAKAK